MTTKNKLRFGNKNILDDDALSPRNVKVRITTFIDEDVLIADTARLATFATVPTQHWAANEGLAKDYVISIVKERKPSTF